MIKENRNACGMPFDVFPGCRDCLLGLAETAAGLSAGDDKALQQQALDAAREVILSAEGTPQEKAVTSPELANRMLAELRRLTGTKDPYQEIKIREMVLAREIFSRVENGARHDLASAVICASLGNSLDFFRPADEALPSLVNTFRSGFAWQRNDGPALDDFLNRRPGTVVYLTDNAGEVFFDLPLYDHLASRAGKVILTVKGGAALNDLTVPDLERERLLDHFQDVRTTGAAGAGIDWPNVSEEFLELIDTADLIISKGMANFETLYMRATRPPVFFIFKVKCRPVRDYLKAEPESFWALWRDAGSAGPSPSSGS